MAEVGDNSWDQNVCREKSGGTKASDERSAREPT